MKGIGVLVSKGWKYNRREISDAESEIGIIISPPIKSVGTIEKLKRKGERWDIEYLEKIITDQVLVLWSDGLTKYHPICNLVEVKGNE